MRRKTAAGCMHMITMKRTSRAAIDLKCDAAGLDLLVFALQKQPNSIPVTFDRAILNHKKTKYEEKELLFVTDAQAECSAISEADGRIIWTLCAEDAEDAEYVFEQCEKEGCFFSAEFLSVEVKQYPWFDMVYCELRADLKEQECI